MGGPWRAGLLLVTVGAAACGSPGEGPGTDPLGDSGAADGGADGVDGDDTGSPAWEGTAALRDAQQFAYEAELVLPVAPLPPLQDARLDWSGLSTDMLGLPLDPQADVRHGVLARFGTLTPAELAQALAHDVLPQGDLLLYGTCPPDEGAGCALSDFTLAGNDLEAEQAFEEGPGTWLVALTSLSAEGTVRYRSLLVLEPRPEATQSTASFAEGACRFELEVDLDAGAPVRVPVGEVPVVDWSGLTVDGRGAPLPLSRVDRLRLARFDDLGLAELEARLPELPQLADAAWMWDVQGASSVSLAEAPLGGTTFAGLTGEGLWLLSLECASCTSPMPLFLAVVEPGAG